MDTSISATVARVRHSVAFASALASSASSSSTDRLTTALGVFFIVDALSPKRSVESVSRAEDGAGEQQQTTIVLEFPPSAF